MQETKITCISCPRGCCITLRHEDGKILEMSGNRCKNGIAYAENEFLSPVRVLTSTVLIAGGELPLLPVKTKAPIPKGKMRDCMRVIFSIEARAPVKLGDVICDDICGTGTDLIATRDLEVVT
jgi:CxxC motif-containing protein